MKQKTNLQKAYPRNFNFYCLAVSRSFFFIYRKFVANLSGVLASNYAIIIKDKSRRLTREKARENELRERVYRISDESLVIKW